MVVVVVAYSVGVPRGALRLTSPPLIGGSTGTLGQMTCLKVESLWKGQWSAQVVQAGLAQISGMPDATGTGTLVRAG
jgi:hypothetical protein